MQEEALNPGLVTSVETPSASQSASNDKRLRRIQRLMWATSLGVALTLPAAIAVPIWPKLAPISSIVLILTAIGLYLMASWVNRAIQIPDANGRFPRWWERQNAKTTRPHIKRAIDIAGFLYFYGAVLTLLEWWSFTKDWDSLRIGIGIITGGLVVYVFFALLWVRSGSKIDQFMNPTIGQIMVVGIAAAFFALSFFVVPAIITKLNAGPAAPWSEQWALVQQAVIKKYPDAALDRVIASPEYDVVDVCDGSLNTTFYLEGATGASLNVSLRDSNPEASLQVRDSGTYSPVYSGATLARLKATSADVQISPRDAFLKAKAAFEKETPDANVCSYRSMTLFLQETDNRVPGAFSTLNKPSAWQVSLNDINGTDKIYYWIDAQTGDVLLRENK